MAKSEGATYTHTYTHNILKYKWFGRGKKRMREYCTRSTNAQHLEFLYAFERYVCIYVQCTCTYIYTRVTYIYIHNAPHSCAIETVVLLFSLVWWRRWWCLGCWCRHCCRCTRNGIQTENKTHSSVYIYSVYIYNCVQWQQRQCCSYLFRCHSSWYFCVWREHFNKCKQYVQYKHVYSYGTFTYIHAHPNTHVRESRLLWMRVGAISLWQKVFFPFFFSWTRS